MKDFFDEEFEKQQEKERQQKEDSQRQVSEWYASGVPSSDGSSASGKRPLYIALICIALVLAIVLGWVLCSIFGTGSSKEEELLSTVRRYLETEYYQDVTDAQMQAAIAAAGTAMLQSAGDQFCQLMSPQQFYDYVMQVDNSQNLSSNDTYFGIGFSHQGIGLYVSTVSTDGSCYGIMQSGDIVVKLTEMRGRNGSPVDAGEFGTLSELNISEYAPQEIDYILPKVYSANFVYLRNGELFNSGRITRGAVGFRPYDPKGKYQFVEYYFNSIVNNISVININNAKHNTYELRGLKNLPADTGYIRISQFMYRMENNNEITAADEFAEVMQIFKSLGLKRLVLDLKGNPGGRVDVVCDIAGKLVTDLKLDANQQASVRGKNGLKITTLVPKKQSQASATYTPSTYEEYFPTVGDKCDIVIWTDGGSASASELLTGALTDYKTGFQIGARTYGKGIAQRIVPLQGYQGKITPVEGDDTSVYYWAIYYTFASYYSPLGTNIHGLGYTPAEGYGGILDYGSKTDANSLWGATYRYWGL